MHSLDLSTVPQWTNVNNLWFPASVDTNCPYCAKLVNFTPTYHQYDTYRKTISSTASCPACNQVVYIWAINPGPALDTTKKGCSCLGIYPPPRLPRQPIRGIDLLPGRVAKAYQDAIGVFNAAAWSATSTCCRRALETTVAHLVPKNDANQPMSERIRHLNAALDLSKPLQTISHAVRPDGKLAASFDLDRDPSPATAQLMLDLLEATLQYLYTVPASIELLDRTVESSLPRESAARPADPVVMAPAKAR